MTQVEQMIFVEELVAGVVTEIIKKIKDKQIPEEWNGIELRRYIAYKFKECEVGDFSGKRKKDYLNTILINNL